MSLTQGSPRLPSPPPPAEIQLGPKSPGLGSTASRQTQQMEQTINAANARRRIHPGTRSEDMAAGPPLVPFNELDSAFQLQEHLAALHYHLSASNTIAISRAAAAQLTEAPPGIDRNLWLYELCRFLIAQCNSLIIGFLFDTPSCSSTTCPEMRASEWQFLCAVHDQPKSCCAIDYCCHTLDWAANIVTNPKIFPSRFVLVSEGHDKSAVLKNLVNVFRRVHRIFAHAWFQHRSVFWAVESQTGLYAFFKTVCDMYDLLPAENYKLPPEAEGLEPESALKEERRPVSIAKPPPPNKDNPEQEDDRNSLHARRNNTARHSSRPSTGSAVTTVMEEGEDDHSEVTERLKNMQLSASTIPEQESELDVPVIVDSGVISDVPLAETVGIAETSDEKDEDQEQTISDTGNESPGRTQENDGDAEETVLLNQEFHQESGELLADESPSETNDDQKEQGFEVISPVSNEPPTSTAAESPGETASSPGENSEDKSAPENTGLG